MKYEKIEYRVRPVTRYIVTRYHEESDDDGSCGAGNSVYGEFDSIRFANRVAVALAGQEPESVNAQCFTLDEPKMNGRLGVSVGSENVSNNESGSN